jgi:transposase-like protein
MAKGATEQEKLRQAKARLRRIQHYEQVTHNVSKTCRFFGVSRRQFYTWLKRYREQGLGKRSRYPGTGRKQLNQSSGSGVADSRWLRVRPVRVPEILTGPFPEILAGHSGL